MSLNVVALNELIAHLEKQPEERFDMSVAYPQLSECGTACCIGGHGGLLWAIDWPVVASVGDKLGLTNEQRRTLFHPNGYEYGATRYPLSRAIATLKRLRDVYEATGQVVIDWGPEPGEEPKREWSAPIVSGGLPSSITDVLNGKPLSLTVEQVDG